MYFSKTGAETLLTKQDSLNLRLSDEFEDNCDYIEFESRKDINADNRTLTLIQLNIRGLTSNPLERGWDKGYPL